MPQRIVRSKKSSLILLLELWILRRKAVLRERSEITGLLLKNMTAVMHYLISPALPIQLLDISLIKENNTTNLSLIIEYILDFR